MSGPAGTGKSRGCLEYLLDCALHFKGMRGLICRKTRTSLTQTALVTFDKQVRSRGDGIVWRTSEQEYRIPGGSTLVVGGLDREGIKIMSGEYDMIYVQEATELDEVEWENLTTRLRHGVMPWQQMIADCNPGPPTHWLKRRADAGKTVMLESRHEDNPSVTPEYLAKLDALTGVRKLRLRLGIWAAAEGMVYEGWDRAIHLVDRSQVPGLVDGQFPGVWPRDWTIDFGYTNPFVWQQWVEDPDGRLYLEREIYRTGRLVEDHARQILQAAGGIRPRWIVCDHDAEDRATLERHLGMPTVGAHKAVSPGIQAVATRLRVAGDGRPRLYLLRDALVERDPALDESKRPASTAEEWDGYVWDTANGRRTGEAPMKRDDHGLDALRYEVAAVDRLDQGRTGETGSFDYRRRQWVG